ncbi:MAG: DUF3501 family protein [Thiothrix sp.]
MEKLTRNDLLSLEQYAIQRKALRAQVIAHKAARKVHIGPNMTLYFEDRLTMQYQIQEMLRIERIFEPEAIQDELDAYNPLIPDGSNWKATLMIEFPDSDERKRALGRLLGIEKHTWVQIGDLPKVYPIANEDLERETTDKTASVHFLRFELTSGMVTAARDHAALRMGVDHPNYTYSVDVSAATRKALVADLA